MRRYRQPNDTPSITYRGVEITYNERNECWDYTLEGKECSSRSLTLTKDRIDHPPNPHKKKFEPIPAIYAPNDRFDEAKRVEITSYEEYTHSKGRYKARIRGHKTRMDYGAKNEQVSADRLHAATPSNEAIVKQLIEIEKQRDRLEDAHHKLMKKLKPVSFPKEGNA